jgi:hypothetical protein
MKKISKREAAANVAKALAEVPVSRKPTRTALLRDLRRKFAELQPLRSSLSEEDRKRFEEIEELMDRLEASNRGPAPQR